jgi:serine/threonine protein kinase
MEYCAGGELYTLLVKQPHRRFAEAASRFYVAEVLLALQYLHLLGFVYRDLKPENVLLHDNGHVLLTDFDLSFCGRSTPSIQYLKSSSLPLLVRCRDARALPDARSRRAQLAEPSTFRTNSFVGTEEYLAPEARVASRARLIVASPPRPRQVINATCHTSAVDWWETGIFLYELLFGYTPFRGSHREQTFDNVLHKELFFPQEPAVSTACKELIRGLLQKDADERLGSRFGADEIKRHAFFSPVSWALIRSQPAPFIPSND